MCWRRGREARTHACPGVLPKTTSPERLRENVESLDAFELAAGDLADLDELEEGKHFCWDPSCVM